MKNRIMTIMNYGYPETSSYASLVPNLFAWRSLRHSGEGRSPGSWQTLGEPQPSWIPDLVRDDGYGNVKSLA